LPRPELKHAFVLKPLADIAPQAVHPLSRKAMAQLWAEHGPVADESMRQVEL